MLTLAKDYRTAVPGYPAPGSRTACLQTVLAYPAGALALWLPLPSGKRVPLPDDNLEHGRAKNLLFNYFHRGLGLCRSKARTRLWTLPMVAARLAPRAVPTAVAASASAAAPAGASTTVRAVPKHPRPRVPSVLLSGLLHDSLVHANVLYGGALDEALGNLPKPVSRLLVGLAHKWQVASGTGLVRVTSVSLTFIQEST